MWVILAFVSALCLGGYDISKKIALREHRVVDVLTLSIVISSLLLSVPLLLSRLWPSLLTGTLFYVPPMDAEAHLLTLVKSCIVLSSWIFGFMSIKHLPISVVSPMQATRPMWTLIGALLIFSERLNAWQWVGVLLATGSIIVSAIRKRRSAIKKQKAEIINKKYYICLALAILIGSCSGLYDKYMMRHYDHNSVQVYYTFYQAVLMLVVWGTDRYRHRADNSRLRTSRNGLKWLLPIAMISILLVVSDNVYMLALSDPDSLIAVVSTIRRGGAVIGFAYGLLFLHEPDPRRKIACMTGILTGLIFLAIGSL